MKSKRVNEKFRLRAAERRAHGLLNQEPPRWPRRSQSPVIQADPSAGRGSHGRSTATRRTSAAGVRIARHGRGSPGTRSDPARSAGALRPAHRRVSILCRQAAARRSRAAGQSAGDASSPCEAARPVTARQHRPRSAWLPAPDAWSRDGASASTWRRLPSLKRGRRNTVHGRSPGCRAERRRQPPGLRHRAACLSSCAARSAGRLQFPRAWS